MRVYYLTSAQYAISNIAFRRIKVSRFNDLNDPFELLAVNTENLNHRKAFRKTKKQLNEKDGLICFSESWDNLRIPRYSATDSGEYPATDSTTFGHPLS